MSPRWLSPLVLAAAIAFAALIALGSDASAQVFRPRSAKGAVVTKAAPVATAAPTTAKKTPAAEAPATSASKAPARAGTARRAGKKRRKPRGDSDDVKIDDDSDEDVKITDD